MLSVLATKQLTWNLINKCQLVSILLSVRFLGQLIKTALIERRRVDYYGKTSINIINSCTYSNDPVRGKKQISNILELGTISKVFECKETKLHWFYCQAFLPE